MFAPLLSGTKEFAKKFRSKTGNNWIDYQQDKNSFVSKSGKYCVLEMERDAATASAMATKVASPNKNISNPIIAASQLIPATKQFVDLIFNQDMFKSAMTAMNVDSAKLPLGALSQSQIAKGRSVLERLEVAIKNNDHHRSLENLSSEFYTLIPSSFGRSRPPVLATTGQVSEKLEMLNVLSDIETAQSMQQKATAAAAPLSNPSDLNYEQLAADMTLLDPTNDDDYKVIAAYFDDTRRSGEGMKLQNVWRVNRHKEEERFANHSNIADRQLLWHGTSVEVVAAILKSGLRIMPHSGGRVGRGIYLADCHEKSSMYTRSARGTTIMFLVEGALGKPYRIKADDPSLRAAPAGFDSVLAMGRKAPPNKKEIEIDGNVVSVPQGKPSPVEVAEASSFAHNEFLLYQESQL